MRYYRQLRGLTTRQLSEKLNIVPATVLGYEQGRFLIPYDIAALSAKVLQISESLLFVNTPAGMVPSDRSNGAHRTGKWCRFTA